MIAGSPALKTDDFGELKADLKARAPRAYSDSFLRM
jgi:hypothetical protein